MRLRNRSKDLPDDICWANVAICVHLMLKFSNCHLWDDQRIIPIEQTVFGCLKVASVENLALAFGIIEKARG